MEKIIIHAWTVTKQVDAYFLPFTHWVYLRQIAPYYQEICLIAPVNTEAIPAEQKLFSLADFDNVWVHELPYGGDGYIAAARYFFSYYRAYKKLHADFNKVYVRYPVPFGWLSKLFFEPQNRTIHFVGYPLEVAKLNPDWSKMKRFIIPLLFLPEHKLYINACKGARVFTNGHHISNMLHKQGIEAMAVTSSTLTDTDFYFDEQKQIQPDELKLLHIGYLRKWKNIDVILKAFAIVRKVYNHATLTIVGDGECKEQLQQLVKSLSLDDAVTFKPHASRREELLSYLRSHHVFCFSSISEGSPRIILEAMANGINVVSTPVGSLPFVFKDNEDIVFANFNDERHFADKIIYTVQNPDAAYEIRKKAYQKAQGFTIDAFLKQVFGISSIGAKTASNEV